MSSCSDHKNIVFVYDNTSLTTTHTLVTKTNEWLKQTRFENAWHVLANDERWLSWCAFGIVGFPQNHRIHPFVFTIRRSLFVNTRFSLPSRAEADMIVVDFIHESNGIYTPRGEVLPSFLCRPNFRGAASEAAPTVPYHADYNLYVSNALPGFRHRFDCIVVPTSDEATCDPLVSEFLLHTYAAMIVNPPAHEVGYCEEECNKSSFFDEIRLKNIYEHINRENGHREEYGGLYAHRMHFEPTLRASSSMDVGAVLFRPFRESNVCWLTESQCQCSSCPDMSFWIWLWPLVYMLVTMPFALCVVCVHLRTSGRFRPVKS